MQLTLREAVPDDYRAIHSLIANELGYNQTDFSKLCARLDLMNADNNLLTIVAVVEEKVVGFVGLCKGIAYNIDGEYMQVSALAVEKALQNKGIGSRLMKWAESYASNNGIENIVLTSRLHRTGAHAFYERNGYVIKSYGFKKDL